MRLTRRELMRYSHIKQEIEELEERIEILESQTCKVTASYSDMPKGGAKKDSVIDLIYNKTELNEKQKELTKQFSIITKYINTIPSVRIRRILTMKYLGGMTSRQIAGKLNSTEDSIRSALYKYLSENKNKNIKSNK